MADEKKEQPERVKDNRRIISGVSLLEGTSMRTFSGDAPEELDALEQALTPEQCKRLKEQGVLDGDWHPRGKPADPMPRSRLDRQGGAQPTGTRPLGNTELEAENVRLRRELEALKKQHAGDHEPEEKHAAHKKATK